MRIRNTGRLSLALAALAQAFHPGHSLAQSSTWTNLAGGSWAGATNWNGGIIAAGSGNTADFSTLTLNSSPVVTLDGAQSIGALLFGDQGNTYGWTLNPGTGGTLTLAVPSGSPIITVNGQTTTLGLVVAGTQGLVKSGPGTLTLSGADTYTGTTLVNSGVLTLGGSGSGGSSTSSLSVGGATNRGVLNFTTSGTWTFASSSGSVLVGGNGTITDTGAGAINQSAGTLNLAYSGIYVTLGNTGTNSYGSYNLSGGAMNIPSGAGFRLGFSGLGSWVQSGGAFSCGRYFSIGGNNATGNGVATFTGGSATINSSYRILIGDGAGATAVMNLGTEAGGTALITHLSTTGVDMSDKGGGANGTLNLDSGTILLGGPVFRNNTGGSATVNLNGGTLRANSGITFLAASLGHANAYNGGVTLDSQTYTTTLAAPILATTGAGIYPAGGVFNLGSGGGAGYIGAPLATVSGGSGGGAMAVANVAGGTVTGVTLTCPGSNYLAGDVLVFSFAGGGATTAANAFSHTLVATDLAPNTAGGLTKLGSGTLNLATNNTYTGSTTVSAGTLNVKVDGGLGQGNVVVAGGAVLTLGGGVTNGYIATTANLVVAPSSTVNLNFTGTETINGLSLDGGVTYQPVGVYGAVGSAAPFQISQLSGTGLISVTATPVGAGVNLVSSVNPSMAGQSVTFTATVSGGGATPTGTVTFFNGSIKLGTATLTGGSASLTTSLSAVGSDSITAVYSGNSTYISSTSLPLTQVVNPRQDLWTGAVSGAWDTTTANWTLAGTPSVYANNDNVQFDDTATSSAVTLAAAVTPGAVVFTNNSQSYTLAGPGGIAGPAGLTVAGTGSLTVSNVNSFGGPTVLQNGTLTFAGPGSSTGGGTLAVGDAVGAAVLNLAGSGTLDYAGTVPVGGLSSDTGDSASGVINQSSGTVNIGSGSSYVELGAGGPTAYGAYNLSGGTLSAVNSSGIRVGALGLGVFTQSGGLLNCSRYFSLGTITGGGTQGGTGVATFTGGSASISSSYRIILGDKPGGVATFNLGTEAGGAASISALYSSGGNGGVVFLSDAAATLGVLNVNSGTLQLAASIWKNAVNTSGTDLLNLNGGTLQAAAANMTLIGNSVDSVLVYNGGVVIDTQTNSDTENVSFQAASGNGIYPAGGTLAVASGGGSGYLGAPQVTVSGGSGANATAIANLTGGVVTEVILTCPGTNYLAGDVVSFTFAGGAPVNPASVFNYTLAAGDVAANNAGGLTKLGSGTLTLNSASSYAGNTTVTAGTLAVAADGGLGLGGAIVASGAALTLGGGATNGYLAPTASLLLGAGAVANLNYSGTDVINGLSVNGGLSYLPAGTYGAPGSGASIEDPHLTGSGFLAVTTTPAGGAVVTLTAAPNPATLGQSVTLTAVVSGAIGAPSGRLTFLDGSVVLGSLNLNPLGVAKWTTVFTTTGSHDLSADYAGNATYQATSGSLELVINPRLDLWTGARNNAWDITTTTNWAIQGAPATYQDGDSVQFDDSAVGATAVSLAATVSPLTVTVSNAAKAYSLAGAGSISGPTPLIKAGPGLLVVSNANSYSGPTQVRGGTLTFAANSGSIGNGLLYVGDDAGTAVVNLASSGVLDFSGSASLGGIAGDAADTGAGAVYQSSGILNLGSSGSYLELGAGGVGAYGFYSLAGGTLNTLNASGLRVGAIGQGVFTQSGGLLNLSRWLAIGTYSGSAGNGGNGVVTFTGGSASVSSSYQIILGDKSTGTGVLNLGTEAGGSATVSALYASGANGGVILLKDPGASSAVLNLNRGTLQLAGSIYKNSGNAVGSDVVSLNGATLQAAADGLTLIGADLDSVLLYNGGVVFDTQTYTDTETVNLGSATGAGIYPPGGTLAISANGGSGYIGAPLVTVTGGSGANATAIATVTNGVVTGVELTCPGTNYLADDVISFSFSGGGTATPAATFSYTLTAADLAANTAGGLTKVGSGTLVLTGLETYPGLTAASNGTLEVDGTLAGPVVVAGGTLDGTGSLAGAVTIQPGGTLAAGTAAAIGQLTASGAVTLSGTAALRLDKTGGTPSNDSVIGSATIGFGGALVVTNITSDTTLLAAGDKFTLFGAAAYTGAFATYTLPALPAGLSWNTANLAVDGSITVSAVSTVPPTITHGTSSGNLTLGWPADHTGWRLLVQTNNLVTGVSTNLADWGTVPGSLATNQVILPLDKTKPAEFYRLIFP